MLECYHLHSCLIPRQKLEEKMPNTGSLHFVSDSACIITETPRMHVLLFLAFVLSYCHKGCQRRNGLAFPSNILQAGVYTWCCYDRAQS